MVAFLGLRIWRGAQAARAPLYFFAEIGRLTLCGHLGQKECTKFWELTLKITFFLRFSGGTSPQTPPVPTGAEVLSVFNLDAPSLKKSWICPWFQGCTVLDLPLVSGLHGPVWGCPIVQGSLTVLTLKLLLKSTLST